MSSKERILDDVAKMAGGAVSVISSAAEQIKTDLKSRADDVASNLDLVPREDFERLQSMVEQMRLEQESIKERIKALEGKKK